MNLPSRKCLLPIRHITSILYLMGLWPTHPSTSTLSWCIYSLYTVAFQSIFIFAYVLFKCINFLYIDDLTVMTLAMFITLTELSLAVKIVNFYARHRTMQLCLRTVERIRFQNIEEEAIFDARMSFLQKIFVAFLVTANTTGVFSYLSPVFVVEPMLPYPGWYPLDWTNNRQHYWMVYAYQVLGMICQIQALVIIEVYFIFLMVVVSAQVEILGKRLERIGYDDCNDDDQLAEQYLEQCVHEHCEVLK